MDYLSLNVYCDINTFFPIWDKYFSAALGQLIDTKRRTAFYKSMFTALAGVTVLALPIQEANEGEFITLTIKGVGCKCISLDLMRQFINGLVSTGVYFKISRFDITWDNLDFTPVAMYQFMKENEYDIRKFRSVAKRRTLKFYEQPFEIDEKGKKGTSGVQFGSRESDRIIRCYDMHGFTRLELQTMSERANIVFLDVISVEDEARSERAKGHLLDFIMLDWDPWREFIQESVRAGWKLLDAREITAERTRRWLGRQVAVSLSVLQDIEPGFTAKLLAHGRSRKGRERYTALLSRDDLVNWQGANLER